MELKAIGRIMNQPNKNYERPRNMPEFDVKSTDLFLSVLRTIAKTNKIFEDESGFIAATSKFHSI